MPLTSNYQVVIGNYQPIKRTLPHLATRGIFAFDALVDSYSDLPGFCLFIFWHCISQETVVKCIAMIFLRNYFVNTTDKPDVFSVIHEVNRTIRESKAKEGLATILVPAPGGAITIIEPLPDIVEKFKEAIRVFPGEGAETKNRRREEIAIGPRVAAAMLGKSVGIPIKDGKLLLGLREEPVLVDLETRGGRREFYVQITGESGEEQQGGQKVPQQMQRR